MVCRQKGMAMNEVLKKNILRLFWGVFSVLCTCQGIAQTSIVINGGDSTGYSIRQTDSSPTRQVFHFKLHSLEDEVIRMEGTSYHRLSVSGGGYTGEVGEPALPTILHNFIISERDSFCMELRNCSWKNLNVGTIFPVQRDYPETGSAPSFCRNDSVFCLDYYRPKQLLTSMVHARNGAQHVSLLICPFFYLPKLQELNVMDEFELVVRIIPNSSSRIVPQSKREGGQYDYLVIVSPALLSSASSAIQKFVLWKNLRGLRTHFVSTAVTGSTCESIKGYISKQYTDSNIRFALFMGDESHIPLKDSVFIFNKEERSTYGDYWYGCMGESSDFIADISVGRFPARDGAELEAMIQKSIDYERSKHVFPKSLFLVAHRWGGYAANLRKVINKSYGKSMQFRTLYGEEETAYNHSVIDSLNTGVNLFCYRGHGSNTAWTFWNSYGDFFTDGMVNESSATDLFVSWNIACQNGAIKSERNMLETYLKESVSCAAFLGATADTYTFINYTYFEKLFEYFLYRKEYFLGNIIRSAMMETLMLNHKSLHSKYNAFSYLCGGDPALELWTDSVQEITGVNVERTESGVSVNLGTLSDCVISVVSGDGVLISNTQTSREESVYLCDIDDGYISIHKHNFIPYICRVAHKNGILYLQNEVLDYDMKIIADNTILGSSVTSIKPEGPVVISAGRNVCMQSARNTEIRDSFFCEKGAVLEIK